MTSIRALVFAACGVLLTACATTGQNDSVEGAVEPDSRTMELYREGMQAYTEGNMEAAEDKLSRVLEQVPEDGQVWFRLGNIYARTNRPRQAVQAYQEALVRDPKLAKAWHNMGVVHLRQAAHDFVSLTRSLPTDDPLHARGTKISNTILALLDELPEGSSVEVDIDLKEPAETDENEQSTIGRDVTGPDQDR